MKTYTQFVAESRQERLERAHQNARKRSDDELEDKTVHHYAHMAVHDTEAQDRSLYHDDEEGRRYHKRLARRHERALRAAEKYQEDRVDEGEVVAFRGKPERFGPNDDVKFKQIHHGRLGSADYLKHIEHRHPLAHRELKKVHDESKHTIERSYASEIHKNGRVAGYMVNHHHRHEGKEYETVHAHDIHGHKLPINPVPISGLGKAD